MSKLFVFTVSVVTVAYLAIGGVATHTLVIRAVENITALVLS